MAVFEAIRLIAFVLASAGVDALSGNEIVCIGDRGHAVEYEFDGTSLEEIRDVAISVAPAPELNSACLLEDGKLSLGAIPSHGDKLICVGANADASCRTASKRLPINAHLDCSNCFVGATTDLYYTLNIKDHWLQEVRVGFRNTYLRGAVEVSAAEKGTDLANNYTARIGEDALPAFHFKVAGIFPVSISLGLDMELSTHAAQNQAVTLQKAGAHMNFDFGDHSVGWTRGHGFSFGNTSALMTLDPLMRGFLKEETNLSFGINSHMKVEVMGVLSYDLNFSLPMSMSVGGKQFGNESFLCAAGGASMEVNHEADLHFDVLGKGRTVLAHFGPYQLYHYQNDLAFDTCLPSEGVDVVEGIDDAEDPREVTGDVEDAEEAWDYFEEERLAEGSKKTVIVV